MSIFGICFILFFLKLSACRGFSCFVLVVSFSGFSTCSLLVGANAAILIFKICYVLFGVNAYLLVVASHGFFS